MSELLDLIIKNEMISRKVIRLVASENLPSVEKRLPFMLDMYARYSFDDDSVWKYPTLFLNDIEKKAENYLKEYLDCKYVSLKPISGLNGMLSAVSAFSEGGDIVLSLDPKDGGHYETNLIIKKLGLKSDFLPFDKSTWKVDIEKLKRYENLDKVRLVYLDLCMVAFPQPVKEIREIINKETLIIFDASHVLGLIVGDKFQQPLKEGADVLISSTHKTFPGSHKAIFATNRRILKWQFDNNCNHFISHHHMAEVAALGLILEKGKDYFVNYAERIVENTKSLSKALFDNGINVQLSDLGFSECHQIWIECGNKEDVDKVIECLCELNIIVNGAIIPSLNGGWGLRIGTQEITNRGITSEGLNMLAIILTNVIKEKCIIEDMIVMKNNILEKHMGCPISYDKVDRIVKILSE